MNTAIAAAVMWPDTPWWYLALAALILLAAGFTLGWIGCAICASGKREDACRAAYNEGIRRAAQTRAELFELATDGLDAGDEP
ncbi:MAG: hypothetical protein BWY52_03347 [Chloroflexi bacterium ADurb.Bin325]|nr:MAG: hypothetical protein BWY52_03347 [Chloroflexi bacterium ADurb.Bin325]